MSFAAFLFSLLFLDAASSSALGQTRHLHSSAGVGSNQLPMYIAKDLGIFEKYGLNVELIVITGGARGLQANESDIPVQSSTFKVQGSRLGVTL